MKKRWLALALVLVLALSLAACTGTAGGQATPAGNTVTDITGAQIQLPEKVEKVVSLAPSVTETIYALGGGDLLVGVDDYSYYPEEAKSLAKVGDYMNPNTESIVSLDPDVVITGNKLQQDTIDKLNELGITTVQSEPTTYDQIYEAIELIGQVIGKADAAQDLISDMTQRTEAVEQKAAGDTDKPSVYFVMSFTDGNWTSGPGTFINEMIEMAGGTCVTADGGAQWMDYSLEELVKRNPQVLLVSTDAGKVEDLKKLNGYKSLSAVKNDRVYEINADIVSRPGPRIVDALEEIYDLLHK